MRLQVLPRLAEVAPVALQRYGAHLAGLDEAREQVLAEVAEPAVAVRGTVGLRGERGPELVERGDQRVGAVDEDLGRDRAGLAGATA